MDSYSASLANSPLPKADVYTDLNSLQSIKNTADKSQALKQVAQQFESMFVAMMLKNMRAANAVFEKDNIFHSKEGEFYRDLLDQQRALTLSHGRGLGIADSMFRQLSRRYSGQKENIVGQQEVPAAAQKSGVGLNKTQHPQGLDSKPPSVNKGFSAAENFVHEIYPHAKHAAKKIGVEPEVLIAQSALETGWGKHLLEDKYGRKSYNFFNIKTGGQWQGESVDKEVLEYQQNQATKELSTFRLYASAAESFADYADFITHNSRYKKALDVAHDAKAYVRALKSSGFATDPKYVEKIIDIREQVIPIVARLVDRVKASAAYVNAMRGQ